MRNTATTPSAIARVESLPDGEGQVLLLPPEFALSASQYRVERVGASLLLKPTPAVDWDEFFARPSEVPSDFLEKRCDAVPQVRGDAA